MSKLRRRLTVQGDTDTIDGGALVPPNMKDLKRPSISEDVSLVLSARFLSCRHPPIHYIDCMVTINSPRSVPCSTISIFVVP